MGDCVRLILGFISWVFSFSGLKIFLFCVDIDNLIWIQHRHIHLLDVDLVLFVKQRFSERGFIKGNDILSFFWCLFQVPRYRGWKYVRCQSLQNPRFPQNYRLPPPDQPLVPLLYYQLPVTLLVTLQVCQLSRWFIL